MELYGSLFELFEQLDAAHWVAQYGSLFELFEQFGRRALSGTMLEVEDYCQLEFGSFDCTCTPRHSLP